MNNSNPPNTKQDSKHDLVTNSCLRRERTSECSPLKGRNELGSGAPLGIVAKTTSLPHLARVSAFEVIDKNTGEVFEIDSSAESNEQRIARASRWELKSAVNRLLPSSTTSKCMVWRKPVAGAGLSDIHVCRGAETKKAFYHGLLTCGSVWNCPVCAAKVSERRRVELKEGLAAGLKKQLRAHFVTLTFPHGISDDLKEITTRMSNAFKRLSTGKYRVKALLKEENPSGSIEGFIRAIEVTHGKNGFHPHVHMIVFTDMSTESWHLDEVYTKAWIRACRLAGLPEPSERHGCTVQDGSFAAEYASKWGIEDEMTKANAKQTRQKGVTPWGLLRCIVEGEDEEYSPERASALFKIYSKTFTGRRQLYWSNGLRKLLDIGQDVTDEELAERPEEERASVLATLTTEQWKAVRKHKQQAALLDLAEKRPDMVTVFIDNLDTVTDSSLDVIQPQEFKDRSQISSPLESRTEQVFTNLSEYKQKGYFDYYATSKERRGSSDLAMTRSDEGVKYKYGKFLDCS